MTPKKRQFTDEDLETANPIADKLIAEMTARDNPPQAVAALAITLAAIAVLAECGPRAPVTLYNYFYRKLALGMNRPDLLDRDRLRGNVATALHELGLLTLANFASQPLEERQRILDRIIEAANNG